NRYTRHQRVFGREQPLGEAESVRRRIRGKRRQRLRCVQGDLFTVRVVSAAFQKVSRLGLRQLVHHHDFGNWIDDAALVAPEGRQLGEELLGGRIDVGHVVVQQSLALGGVERIRIRFPRNQQ